MIDVQELTDLEVDRRIGDLKEKLGNKIFMPVHHYQRDEIVQFADYTGDSLGLSRISADTDARFIVFCGVYFMAEIARVLASEDKYVFIPNRSAGCPLADLASEEDVVRLWNVLQSAHPGEYIPVTYANSHVAIKAFCGKNSGLVCTSSNVQSIFRWILDQGKRVYFMPDKNLGVNTAAAMGLERDHWVAGAGVEWKEDRVRGKKIILWDGYCIVHKVFTLQHVEYWRKRDPSIKIIVHPECEPEVVRASDYSGSTSKIKKMVEDAPSGSQWVIGTEFNLVNRLKNDNPDKLVEPLDKSVCVNMSKIRRRDLLKTLLSIDNGDYSAQVVLPPEQIADAKKAIDKMLEIS